jgi:hypothetical protein
MGRISVRPLDICFYWYVAEQRLPAASVYQR